MKAFLLAAGQGTRLRPLTDHLPKCLLPIAGTPMLQLWFDLCRRYGIDEVLINVHAHAQAVRDFLSHNGKGLRVHVSEEPTLLGSAGTLAANRHWVAGESAFWVFYADVLTNANLHKMGDLDRRLAPVATLGLYEVPDPQRCGIVTLDACGIITEFVEKPAAPKSNLAFSGLLLATPALLDFIPAERPADLGFHVLPRLVGRMAGYRIRDYLIDIGTLENYQAAQHDWAEVAKGLEGLHA
jgi:mannose-1-phosphate guanylyltransferase